MRLLYLTQRVPFPPNRGDKIKAYHELRYLAQRQHEVAVACLADGREDLANVQGLRGLVFAVDAVPLARAAARCRALAALTTCVPLTVAYFNERELHTRVRQRIESGRFDAVVVHSSGIAQFAEPFSGIPRIMQFVDLDSLKWQQYARWAPRPLRWVYRLESRRLLAYERHVAATFEHSLVCTPDELRDLHRLIPGAPAGCIGNGVDLEFFQPMQVQKTRHELIFTGIMDYFPNIDGVVWFCREVLPLVRAEVPEATFTICGARPPRSVQKLERIPGVTVTGSVPDVRPYLARAAVAVVPLRLARGIQNKLLEAMAMRLPAVSTRAAFEGLEASHGTHLFVADDPTSFASAVVQLLRDPDLRRGVGHAARAWVESHYRWETQLARLEELLLSLTASFPPSASSAFSAVH